MTATIAQLNNPLGSSNPNPSIVHHQPRESESSSRTPSPHLINLSRCHRPHRSNLEGSNDLPCSFYWPGGLISATCIRRRRLGILKRAKTDTPSASSIIGYYQQGNYSVPSALVPSPMELATIISRTKTMTASCDAALLRCWSQKNEAVNPTQPKMRSPHRPLPQTRVIHSQQSICMHEIKR